MFNAKVDSWADSSLFGELKASLIYRVGAEEGKAGRLTENESRGKKRTGF